MATPVYDFYGDMLETHRENGYLLVLVVALSFYILGVIVCLIQMPEQDIYLVPGVDRYGIAEVTWGVAPAAARSVVGPSGLDGGPEVGERVEREPLIPLFVPPELTVEKESK